MPAITIPTPEEAAEYTRRVHEVVADFNVLGHGSRLQAAQDLRLPNSAVSGILNMRGMDQRILDNLAVWAKEQRQARGV